MVCKLSKENIENLKHKQYGVYGKHSAVAICSWNKKALKDEGVCYKQKFYNVECHRCAQITPTVLWCNQNCVFCWRPANKMLYDIIDSDFSDNIDDIIGGLCEERVKLLSGFKGNKNVSLDIYNKALVPSHFAISLSGEPTLYKDLDVFIKKIKERKQTKTVFLVTNGLEPDILKKLNDNNCLPTQLYVSIESSNKKQHMFINQPKIKDSWERLNKTIDLLPNIKTRRVIRFTLIKDINSSKECLDDFLEMFERTNTDFLEIKSYMYLGASRNILKKENMPSYEECLKYAQDLEKKSKLFKIVDSCERSQIVLLKNKNSSYKNFILK
jgi:tRNA wybutosine-synthesizing protein 1